MDGARNYFPHRPARNRRLPAGAYSIVGAPVLVTLRAYRARPFEGNPPLCENTLRLLREMRGEYACGVGAFCLMPNHLHFITWPVEEGASTLTLLARFSGKSTNESWRFGWTGKLWQKRGHDHLLRLTERADEAYAYILNNPVRAGLVEDAADYP